MPSHTSSVQARGYQYSNLNKSKCETRIFVLEEEVTTSRPLRLKLSNVSLNEKPNYYAISYACGDVSQKVPVLVDGSVFHIHRSLDIALRNMAGKFPGRILWADVICINQGDNGEKSYQVAQMGRVYQQAQSVMIWLGELTPDLTKAAIGLMDLAMEFHTGQDWKELNLGERNSDYVTPADQRAILRVAAQGNFKTDTSQEVLKTISLIFALPWWERAWTVQEYALSRDANFFIGGIMIGANTIRVALSRMFHLTVQIASSKHVLDGRDLSTEFYSALQEKIKHEEYLELLGFCINRSKAVMIQSAVKNQPESYTLRRLLTQMQGFGMTGSGLAHNSPMKTTDPRDQVFAVINLATDRERLNIRPDYGKPFEEIFMDTTKAFVRTGDVNVLSFASSEKKNTLLPSWCVDWSQNLHMTMLQSHHLHKDDWNYKATLNAKVKLNICSSFPRILSLSAIVVDVVESVTQATFPRDINIYPDFWSCCQFGFDTIHKFAQPIAILLQQFQPFLDLLYILKDVGTLSQTTIEACAITPIAGKVSTTDMQWGKVDTQDCMAAFQFWMRLVLGGSPIDMNELMEKVKTSVWYTQAMGGLAGGKKLFVTKSGHIGLGLRDIRPGDEVVLFFGADMPYIIREDTSVDKEVGVPRQHRLIGEAYIHGMMEGECMSHHLERTFIYLV